MDGQPGASPQACRLDDRADPFARRRDVHRPAAGLQQALQVLAAQEAQAARHGRLHAHGVQAVHRRRGIAQPDALAGGKFAGTVQTRARETLVQHRQQDQGERAAHGQPTQGRVQQKDDRQVDDRPGRVQKGQHGLAGEELLDRLQLREGLHVALGRGQLRIQQAPVQPGRDLGVQVFGHLDQHPPAHALEQGMDEVDEHHDERQAQQRVVVVAGQHPVIDLQHVPRGCQHERIGHGGEHRDREVLRLEAAHEGRQGRGGSRRQGG